MHILLTGGGSGGHVTPLLAVAHELKKQAPDCQLSYMGEKGGSFGRLVEESGLFNEVHYISAGKFRRYHNESIIKRIIDVKTNMLNIRDVARTIRGLAQAKKILKKIHPDVLFMKGGFVCVPVGVAAHQLKLPFITHDSDAVPGLANKIIGKWAKLHTTGLPIEFYDYPKDKTKFVGVPVSDEFKEPSNAAVKQSKLELGIPRGNKVVLVTGGSQGSVNINKAVRAVANELLKDPSVNLLHHVGQKNENLYGDFKHGRLNIAGFYDDFANVATAADVIVTRAGANSMTEFGVLKKACIVVPSPFLANGHQLKNADELSRNNAIIELEEKQLTDKPQLLLDAIRDLLGNETRRHELAKNLHGSVKQDAAKELAAVLINYGSDGVV